MNGLLRALTTIGLAVILSGCMTNKAKEQLNAYQQGMVFRDTFPIANHRVPLPPGDWIYIANHFFTNDFHYRPFATISLLKIHNGVVTDGVLIESALDQGGASGYVKSPFFERNDLIYKEVAENTMGRNQDGWAVNYYQAVRGNNTDPATLKTIKYINKNNLSLSNFIVFSRHRLTKQGSFLRYLHFSNPDYYTTVIPEPPMEWIASGWHVDRYFKDPKRVEFIDHMKEQGRVLHERLKQGFTAR